MPPSPELYQLTGELLACIELEVKMIRLQQELTTKQQHLRQQQISWSLSDRITATPRAPGARPSTPQRSSIWDSFFSPPTPQPLPLLQSVVEVCELWIDPDTNTSILPEDSAIKFGGLLAIERDMWKCNNPFFSSFVIRLTLDRYKMQDSKLNTTAITDELRRAYGSVVLVRASNSQDPLCQPVVRVRFICPNQLHHSKICFSCKTHAKRHEHLKNALGDAIQHLHAGNGAASSFAVNMKTLVSKFAEHSTESETPRLVHTTDPRSRYSGSYYDSDKKQLAFSASTATCIICLDDVNDLAIVVATCGCYYCKRCLDATFEAGFRHKQSFPPKCCDEPLDILDYHSQVNPALIKRFTQIVDEFSCPRPIFCPNQNTCPEFMIRDVFVQGDRCICPQCKSVICTHCRENLTAHQESDVCPQDGTEALRETAENNAWGTCPGCSEIVERSEGCNHMMCLCGQQFCYQCGVGFTANPLCDCDLGDDDDDDDNDDDDDDDDDDDNDEEEDGVEDWDADDTDLSDDEEFWPNRSAAIEEGYMRCRHTNTDPVEGERLWCHSCIEDTPSLFRCTRCWTELCEPCLESGTGGNALLYPTRR